MSWIKEAPDGATHLWAALGDVATPELYLGNPFRLLGGLPTDARAEPVRKALQRAPRVRPGGALGDTLGRDLLPGTIEAVERLRLRLLNDTVRRLVDELFWVWPRADGDAALIALDAGDVGAALASWSAGPSDGVALHNRAVLAHLAAFDEAGRLLAGRGSPEVFATAMERSLALWGAALDHPGWWQAVTSRGAALDAVRLGPNATAALRGGLPRAIVAATVRVAHALRCSDVAAAQAAAGDAAACLRAWLPRPEAALLKVTADTLAPARDAIVERLWELEKAEGAAAAQDLPPAFGVEKLDALETPLEALAMFADRLDRSLEAPLLDLPGRRARILCQELVRERRPRVPEALPLLIRVARLPMTQAWKLSIEAYYDRPPEPVAAPVAQPPPQPPPAPKPQPIPQPKPKPKPARPRTAAERAADALSNKLAPLMTGSPSPDAWVTALELGAYRDALQLRDSLASASDDAERTTIEAVLLGLVEGSSQAAERAIAAGAFIAADILVAAARAVLPDPNQARARLDQLAGALASRAEPDPGPACAFCGRFALPGQRPFVLTARAPEDRPDRGLPGRAAFSLRIPRCRDCAHEQTALAWCGLFGVLAAAGCLSFVLNLGLSGDSLSIFGLFGLAAALVAARKHLPSSRAIVAGYFEIGHRLWQAATHRPGQGRAIIRQTPFYRYFSAAGWRFEWPD